MHATLQAMDIFGKVNATNSDEMEVKKTRIDGVPDEQPGKISEPLSTYSTPSDG
jgi:hypothetical protein